MAFFQIVAHGVAFGGAGAAQGVVAAAGVADDLQHRAIVVGAQHGAQAQVQVLLAAQGIHGAVALGGVIGVEEQRIRRLVAFQIGDTQRLPGVDAVQPVIAGADGFAVNGRGCGVHHQAPA